MRLGELVGGVGGLFVKDFFGVVVIEGGGTTVTGHAGGVGAGLGQVTLSCWGWRWIV